MAGTWGGIEDSGAAAGVRRAAAPRDAGGSWGRQPLQESTPPADRIAGRVVGVFRSMVVFLWELCVCAEILTVAPRSGLGRQSLDICAQVKSSCDQNLVRKWL